MKLFGNLRGGALAKTFAIAAANALPLTQIVRLATPNTSCIDSISPTPAENALVGAVYAYDRAAVESLVHARIRIHLSSACFGYPLFAAVCNRKTNVLQFLLGHTQRTEKLDYAMETKASIQWSFALGHASASGLVKNVQTLLDYSPQFTVDSLSHLAINEAMLAHHEEIFYMLIRHKLESNCANDSPELGEIALRTAVQSNCESLMQYILSSKETRLSQYKLTIAVRDAIRLGHAKAAKLLFHYLSDHRDPLGSILVLLGKSMLE